MSDTEIHALVKDVHRLPNSKSGNPHWRVRFIGQASGIEMLLQTEPDAECNYFLSESSVEKLLFFVIKDGRICKARSE